jgi:4-hydroxymandelate oxidase
MGSAVNLQDFEIAAREVLSDMDFSYFAGGANDELTLAENLAAWSRIRLRPRAMVDVGRIDTTAKVLGETISRPVLTAPCSFNKLAHPDGELGVARATAEAGTIQVVSMQATTTIQEIAKVPGGRRWFQLACLRDREITRALVQQAEGADCTALCLTVDVPYLGRRERDFRTGFHLRDDLSMVMLDPFVPAELAVADGMSSLARFVNQLWDPTLTWEAIGWLRSITSLPILAKGILTGEDARLAVEHGAAGVIVSNHGGRQLDGAISTCAALPDVVAAVDGRVDVLVDGGIRRGTDILRALALGANAVLIGRPYLWGLASSGGEGVRQVLALLAAELRLSMGLAGRPTLADVDATLLGS